MCTTSFMLEPCNQAPELLQHLVPVQVLSLEDELGEGLGFWILSLAGGVLQVQVLLKAQAVAVAQERAELTKAHQVRS